MTAFDTCTISGYLTDVTGAPRKGVPLTFRDRGSPLTLGNYLVSGSRTSFTTDREGFVTFALIQGVSVYVDFPGRPDLKIVRTVPTLSAVDLVAWLFPYITEVLYTGDADLELAPGDVYSPTFTATLSDGTSVECPLEFLTLESADEDVAVWSGSKITAVLSGTTTLQVTAVDQSFLETNKTLAGEDIPRLGLSEVLFPDPIDVTVS